MFSRYRFAAALIVLLLMVVGCQSMTGRTAGRYVDDQTITAEVKSKLVGEQASNLTRVGVTTTNGVVYLTGSVDTSDRAARAAELASRVEGVKTVVNNIQITPRTTLVTTELPPRTNVVSGQPLIDAGGTVDRYDAQTGIITFRDGRMVKLMPGTAVWGPASVAVIQPGAQVMVQNAQAVGFQPTGTQPGVATWRMGTVNHVDQANGLIFLNDGTVVRVGPSTVLQSGNQRIALPQITPGTQIAIGLPGAATVTVPAASGASASYGSTLPRQTVAPLDSPQIQIFVLPAR